MLYAFSGVICRLRKNLCKYPLCLLFPQFFPGVRVVILQ